MIEPPASSRGTASCMGETNEREVLKSRALWSRVVVRPGVASAAGCREGARDIFSQAGYARQRGLSRDGIGENA